MIPLPSAGKHLPTLLRLLCILAAGWFTLAFAYVGFASMSYPFNLEWMEGQTIDVIQRILAGQSVYAEPSLDYVAFIYTPLYYYVSALVTLLTGVGFFPARLVSVLAALGSGALVYQWIRKENGSWHAGLLGAGLFFSTYRLSGRWFDDARVDSLFIFLTMAGLYVLFHYRGWKAAVSAGALMAAAFFTKQSALIMILPALAAFVLVDWRHALVASATLGVLLLFGIACYDWATSGWFSFFVFKVPAGHRIARPLLMDFWKVDLLPNVGYLLAISVVMLVLWCLEEWRRGLAYAALAIGFLGAAYLSRLHMYGYINVLMPAHIALALFAGLAYSYFERTREQLVLGVLSCVVLFQMYGLLYNPAPLVPSQKALDTGNKFLEEIAKIDGDILMTDLQYVQTRVGKKSYALGMAAFDVVRSDLKDRMDVRKKLEKELEQVVASGRFSAIMPGKLLMLPQLFFYYKYGTHIDYPQEYVSGAINFLKTDIYLRKLDTERPQKRN